MPSFLINMDFSNNQYGSFKIMSSELALPNFIDSSVTESAKN
jgi:hypothetical protein